MTWLRVPHTYSRLLEAGYSRKDLSNLFGFRYGYWIHEQSLEKAAEHLGVSLGQLYVDPEETANRRFQKKLRGNLASYLFEEAGAFKFDASPSHMKVLGVEPYKTYALPVRVTDALLLEKRLKEVLGRAQALLLTLEEKFRASEDEAVFSDQITGGQFKPRGKYRQGTTNEFTVFGTKYLNISEVARAHHLSYERLQRFVREKGVPPSEMNDEDWKECIELCVAATQPTSPYNRSKNVTNRQR